MCPNMHDTVGLVRFTEEILDGKLHFLSIEGKPKNVNFSDFPHNVNYKWCCLSTL